MRRERLPEDLDVNSISLKDLINLKAKNDAYKFEQKRYRNLFASHPDVRKINLQDPDSSKVTTQLLELERDGKQGQAAWKTKLTTSINNYLDDAPITDEGRRQLLKLSVSGHKYNTFRINESQQRENRLDKKEIIEEKNRKRKAKEAEIQKETGLTYKQHLLRRLKNNPILNQPLEVHIGREATALEAEEKARGLLHLYTCQNALTKKLSRYLRDREVSQDDYDVAMGLRMKTVKNAYRKTKLAKGKALRASGDASIPPFSMSRSESMGSASHDASQSGTAAHQFGQAPSTPYHHTPSHSPPRLHVLPEEPPLSPQAVRPAPADWKLLEDFLHD